MRKGFLGSLAILALGAGLSFGQPMGPVPPTGGAPGGPGGAPMGMDPSGEYGSGGGVLGGMFGTGQRRFWGGAEALYWVPDSMRVPYPMVTTSAPVDLGVINRNTTASIGPGERSISFDSVAGFRALGGFVIDESGEFAVEGSGFWLDTARRNYYFASNGVGMPVLALPFFDLVTGTQASYVVSFPGINTGSINIDVESRVWGAEVNGVYNLYQSQEGPGGLSLMAGPRYLQLREQLNVNTTSTTFVVPPPSGAGVGGNPTSYFPGGGGLFAGAGFGIFPPPYVVTTSDRVKTRNDFYGGQVGFRGDIGFGSYFMNLTGKVGAGYMRSYVDLAGESTFSAAGSTSTQPGGFYNLAQDLGRHRRDQLAFLGEGGFNVGYQFGTFLRLQAGYQFLWVNRVLRPTRSTTEALVPNLIPTSPTYNGVGTGNISNRDITGDTDYHLHGFNLGIQIGF